MKRNEISFYNWCIKNKKEEYLSLWDYEKNDITPKDISFSSHKKAYFKCRRNIHSSELYTIGELTRKDSKRSSILCSKCNSFGQLCVDNNKNELLGLWDYELNGDITPFDVPKSSKKKYYFKCENGIHNSEKRTCSSLILNNFKDGICFKCRSFGHFLISNFGNDALEKYWSDSNTENPFLISKNSGKKVKIICTSKEYHGEYDISCDKFVKGQRCPYCNSNSGKIHPKDSFAQYHINNTDLDFLIKYWDYDKNIKDPFSITKSNDKKVWIKCQDSDYHGSYEIRCSDFTAGYRCSYCGNKKVHILNSVGHLNEEAKFVWSDKNNKTYYDFKEHSTSVVWWKCHNGIHDDYERSVNKSHRSNFKCPYCTNSKMEHEIDKYLTSRKIEYVREKEYFGLIGLRGGNLRYDFYLPKYKLLIEAQGKQHYEAFDYFDGENGFKIRQEHDRRKREYAKNNKIDLLEIPYWEFDDIENILKEKLHIS